MRIVAFYFVPCYFNVIYFRDYYFGDFRDLYKFAKIKSSAAKQDKTKRQI